MSTFVGHIPQILPFLSILLAAFFMIPVFDVAVDFFFIHSWILVIPLIKLSLSIAAAATR